MRLILSVFIALSLFCGCKARKVYKATTDSSSATHTAIKTNVVQSDSEHVVKKQNTYTLTTDSGRTVTTIKADTNHPSSYNATTGVLSGYGLQVTQTKTHSKKKLVDKKASSLYIGVGNAITGQTIIESDTATVKKVTKQVDAKPSYSWLICIGLAGMAGGLIYYLRQKKKKPPTEAPNTISK